VLFIDIGMPKINGYQLARHLRRQSRFADSLLVAITGWADEPHRRLWADAFDHYLNKPVDPPALEKLLRDRGRLVRSRIGGEMNCLEAGPVELLGDVSRRSPASVLVAAGITGRSPAAPALC
jgi:CheY-like chemotaxis protein